MRQGSSSSAAEKNDACSATSPTHGRAECIEAPARMSRSIGQQLAEFRDRRVIIAMDEFAEVEPDSCLPARQISHSAGFACRTTRCASRAPCRSPRGRTPSENRLSLFCSSARWRATSAPLVLRPGHAAAERVYCLDVTQIHLCVTITTAITAARRERRPRPKCVSGKQQRRQRRAREIDERHPRVTAQDFQGCSGCSASA